MTYQVAFALVTVKTHAVNLRGTPFPLDFGA